MLNMCHGDDIGCGCRVQGEESKDMSKDVPEYSDERARSAYATIRPRFEHSKESSYPFMAVNLKSSFNKNSSIISPGLEGAFELSKESCFEPNVVKMSGMAGIYSLFNSATI